MNLLRKKILLVASFFSLSVFGETDFIEETVVSKQGFYSGLLKCIVPIGRAGTVKNRIYTELDVRFLSDKQDPPVKINHEFVTSKGCQLAKLDQIVENSSTSYGYFWVDVKVVKKTSKDARIIFGECKRNYNEKLSVDLGNGIILNSSERGILIPASDC